MVGQTYRFQTPTLAIMTLDDGQRVPMTIPIGGMVEVSATDINGNRLLDVRWEGKLIMLFTIDLREKSELVSSVAR